MGSMIWHPEEGDKKASEYLDNVNHAPYSPLL